MEVAAIRAGVNLINDSRKRKAGSSLFSRSDIVAKRRRIVSLREAVKERVQEATVLRDGDDLLQPGDEQYLEPFFFYGLQNVVICNQTDKHGFRCKCGKHQAVLFGPTCDNASKFKAFLRFHRGDHRSKNEEQRCKYCTTEYFEKLETITEQPKRFERVIPWKKSFVAIALKRAGCEFAGEEYANEET